jgi:TRAP-type C4-dicarboxylate transport system permease small subunit
MDKIIDILDFILMKVLTAVIILIALMVIISVSLRYLFGISYVWFQELIVLMFIFTTFFGSVAAFKRDEHLAIDIFYRKFPPKIKNFVNIIFDILIVYLNWQIINVSIKWIKRVGNVVNPGMRIPMSYFYAILPISSFFLLIYLFGDIRQKIKDIRLQE